MTLCRAYGSSRLSTSKCVRKGQGCAVSILGTRDQCYGYGYGINVYAQNLAASCMFTHCKINLT